MVGAAYLILGSAGVTLFGGIPLILGITLLSVTWPLLLACFGIWGTFRIVKAMREA
jgi:hypothetical protein